MILKIGLNAFGIKSYAWIVASEIEWHCSYLMSSLRLWLSEAVWRRTGSRKNTIIDLLLGGGSWSEEPGHWRDELEECVSLPASPLGFLGAFFHPGASAILFLCLILSSTDYNYELWDTMNLSFSKFWVLRILCQWSDKWLIYQLIDILISL